ncbi:MAG: hypothetical protein MUO24_03380 [Desulfobacterales bacterium]|nr:hypothetical protein [Desulfobacterales bacterium]
MVPFVMTTPRPCHTYYYGGLPVKGTRRKGRLRIEGKVLFFKVPKGKGGEEVDLKIPFPAMEKITLTRDNYYGSDTCLFNLTFRDEQGKSFTLRFAPIIIIPRRRIALQQQWFDFLTQAINAPAKTACRSQQ